MSVTDAHKQAVIMWNEQSATDTPLLASCAIRNSNEEYPVMSERYSNAHMRPKTTSGVSKCMACGEVFSSIGPFDLHQRIVNGKVVCTHPLDRKDKDGNPKPMVVNSRGLWALTLRDPDTLPD